MSSSSGANIKSLVPLMMFLTGAATLGWTVLWLYAYPNYEGVAQAVEQAQMSKTLERANRSLDRIDTRLDKRERRDDRDRLRRLEKENKSLKLEKERRRRDTLQ